MKLDQFSFSFVLYWALYGERPFPGRSQAELRKNMLRGNFSVPPKNSEVPAWIREIILKGLSQNPEKRHPSIGELREALRHDPEEEKKQKRALRSRRLSWIALILLAFILPVGTWYGLRYRTVQLCKAAEAEFVGVWDEVTKASLQKAFLSTKAHFAVNTWQRVESIFDS